MILGGGPSGYAYEAKVASGTLAGKCANFCGNLPRSIEVNQFLVTRPDGSTKLQLKGTVTSSSWISWPSTSPPARTRWPCPATRAPRS